MCVCGLEWIISRNGMLQIVNEVTENSSIKFTDSSISHQKRYCIAIPSMRFERPLGVSIHWQHSIQLKSKNQMHILNYISNIVDIDNAKRFTAKVNEKNNQKSVCFVEYYDSLWRNWLSIWIHAWNFIHFEQLKTIEIIFTLKRICFIRHN